MRTHIVAGAAIALALVLVGSAWAEEQNLKFRLVVTDMSTTDSLSRQMFLVVR